MKVQFIYFDIGGVLLDHFISLRKIAQKLQIPEKETILFFHKHANEIDKGTLSWSKFEDIFYRNFHSSKHIEIPLATFFVRNLAIIQESQKLILELKNSFEIGILSNNSTDLFQMITHNNLIPKINYIVTIISEEVGFLKPEKQLFEIATRITGFQPEEILLIDDNEANISAAKQNGWQALQFDTLNPLQSVQNIKKLLET